MSSHLEIVVSGTVQSALPTSPLVRTPPGSWNGVVLEEHELPPYQMPDHSVPYYLVALSVSAEPNTRYWHESGRERSCVVGNGYVGVLSPGELRGFRWDKAARMIAVRIDPSLMRALVSDELHGQDVQLYPERGRDDPELRDLMFSLQADAAAGSPTGPILGESLSTRLAVEVCRKYSIERVRVLEYRGGLPKPTLRRVLEYIDTFLDRNVTLDELAQVAALSKYHFGKAFKTSTGFTIHQYVLALRISRAERLLRGCRVPLEEIGAAVGFANQSHFTSVFSRRMGISPGRFRQID